MFGCLDSAEKNAACVTNFIFRGDAAKLPAAEAISKPAAVRLAALQTETLPTARMFRYDAIGKAAEDSDLFETVTRTGG